jgi:hypothetical protein
VPTADANRQVIFSEEDLPVSTFYVLPPRPLLARRLADLLSGMLPGLDWDRAGWAELIEALEAAAARHPDVYLVYREDLPEGEDVGRALAKGFGAEDGDQVFEMLPGGSPDQPAVRRWHLGGGRALSA